MTKTEIENKLSKGIWKVIFKKLNGELRVLLCTRDFDNVAKGSNNWEAPSGTGKRSNEYQVTVWDIDNNSWRSFRSDRVISIRKYSDKVSDSIMNEDFLSVSTIKNKLHRGIYKLRYRKLDDFVHETLGTLDVKYLPNNENTYSKSSRRLPDYQVIYYDLVQGDWRSFRSFALISMVKVSEKNAGTNTNIGVPKDILDKNLETGIYKITFLKKDGSIREMRCTKSPKYMDNYDGEYYDHLVTVYDLEKKDYRNIIYKNILKIRKMIEKP